MIGAFSRRSTSMLGHACAVLIAAMAVLLSIQVIGRFVFHQPPDWTEELSRVVFVYATFFGGALAVERGAHLGIDVFTRALPERLSTFIGIVWRLIACGLLGLIVWHGYLVVDRLSSQPLTSVPLSKGWMFAGVPIGCAMMLLYEIGRIVGDVRFLRTGRHRDAARSRVEHLSEAGSEHPL